MRVELPVIGPYDLVATLRGHQLGRSDPTMEIGEDGHVTKATRTADGWVVVHARHDRERALVDVDLEGPGAGLAAPALAAFLGLHDEDATRWDPEHPRLRALARQRAGVRLVRALDLFEAHVIAILQQRVTYGDAVRSYRSLHLRFGEVVARGMRAPLDAAQWRALPSYESRACGVDRHRHAAVQAAARSAHRTRACADPAALRTLFAHVPGTGPWTTEMVAGFAMGDADAVVVGDVNLPRQVAALLGDREHPSDERMLALLEPFRPHRFRVLGCAVSGRVSGS